MLDSPKSSMTALIVFPPGPITLPIESSSMLNVAIRGTVAGNSDLDVASALFISPKMWRRPTRACSRARSIVCTERPSHLISS